MIRDESRFREEADEDPKKKEDQALYKELVRLGIEKDLEMIDELFDPNVIGEKIEEEMARVNNT